MTLPVMNVRLTGLGDLMRRRNACRSRMKPVISPLAVATATSSEGSSQRRRLLSVAIVVVFTLAVSGCASSSTAASGNDAKTSGATITVYSGQHEQTVRQLVDAFTRSTGIKVSLRSGNEAELSNQILQEGVASPADVFYAGNPPAIEALSAKNLMSPVTPTTLLLVPATDNSAQGAWVGVSARSGALIYNTNAVTATKLPASVLELATPAWKGKFAFAPTETDFTPIVTAIVKVKGVNAARAFLTGLKANAKAYEDNEAIVAAVNRGEVATGLVEHYYWYRLKAELGASKIQSALHYFSPGDPGGLLAVSGAGVLRSSTHQQAAQQFLAFLVSKPAQTIIATSQSFEYPLANGVFSQQPLRPMAQLKPPSLSPGDLGDGKQVLQLLQDSGLL